MCAEQGDQERLQVVWDKLVAAYRSALEVGTEADLPQLWAMLHNNLGKALYQLGRRSSGKEEGRKLLEDAIIAYRSALDVRTKADLPQDWAMTQNNLSDALSALGSKLEGEKSLERQRESVEVRRDVDVLSSRRSVTLPFGECAAILPPDWSLIVSSRRPAHGAKRLKGWLMRSATGSRKATATT